jgi:hypothetical protein
MRHGQFHGGPTSRGPAMNPNSGFLQLKGEGLKSGTFEVQPGHPIQVPPAVVFQLSPFNFQLHSPG